MTIEAIELAKSFGSRPAIESISFKIEPGTIAGLLGVNGAGKSTTMRLLAGAMTPDHGRARIDGICVQDDRIGALSRLGYLPEAAIGYGGLTPREFLRFVSEARGLHGQACVAAIERVAAALNLFPYLDHPIGSLSKGWRQRAWLAQALLHEPRALILDEPTDGLDPAEKVSLRNYLRRTAADKAVLVSTHILEEADDLCDRIIIIARGRVAVDASRDDLVRTYGSLAAAFAENATAARAAGRDGRVGSGCAITA